MLLPCLAETDLGAGDVRYGCTVSAWVKLLLYRKHTVALGGLWCLCAAYYIRESLGTFTTRQRYYIVLSYPNPSQTVRMSGRDQRPFWEELLISSSVLDALSDSSSPSSRPSTVDIPLPHRSAAHRAKPYARGRGSLSLETRVSRNSAVALPPSPDVSSPFLIQPASSLPDASSSPGGSAAFKRAGHISGFHDSSVVVVATPASSIYFLSLSGFRF